MPTAAPVNGPTKPVSIRLRPKQYEKLARMRDRDGVTVQEHIRIAVDLYIVNASARTRR